MCPKRMNVLEHPLIRQREREREREGEREREFIFDLQNLVVTLANACHEIISNLQVTALTLNTFVQTLISLESTRAYRQ